MKILLLLFGWVFSFLVSTTLGILAVNVIQKRLQPPEEPKVDQCEALKERMRQVEGWTEYLAKQAGFEDVCLGSEQCPEPSDPVPPWRKEE